MQNLEDFGACQRVHGDRFVIIATEIGNRLADPHSDRPSLVSYLRTIKSSSASALPSPDIRCTVTELTMLPPNLCSCTSGNGLRPATRGDAIPGSAGPEDALKGDSRSIGSVLSTSEPCGADVSSWTRTPRSAISMKAHSPLSEPPTPIQPYPAARHLGSNGITAIVSRFRAEM